MYRVTVSAWDHAFTLIRHRGFCIDPGLTDSETAMAEQYCQARFPPDLVDMLHHGLPVGGKFPDWRHLPDSIKDQLSWPLEGIVFDVEHNGFWLAEWGARPDTSTEAVARAAAYLDRAPRLIPLFGHRYLPSEPRRAGNPVLSVYQTDIIYYGTNLASWFEADFGAGYGALVLDRVRAIEFWSKLVD